MPSLFLSAGVRQAGGCDTQQILHIPRIGVVEGNARALTDDKELQHNVDEEGEVDDAIDPKRGPARALLGHECDLKRRHQRREREPECGPHVPADGKGRAKRQDETAVAALSGEATYVIFVSLLGLDSVRGRHLCQHVVVRQDFLLSLNGAQTACRSANDAAERSGRLFLENDASLHRRALGARRGAGLEAALLGHHVV
eukprot:5892191-Prymnesium_polylepis.2